MKNKWSVRWPNVTLLALLGGSAFPALANTINHNLMEYGLAVGALLATLAVLLIQFNSQRSMSSLTVAFAVVLTVVMLLIPLSLSYQWLLFGTIFVIQSFAHLKLYQEVPSRRVFILLASVILVLCGVSEFVLSIGMAWLAVPMLLSAVVCFGDGWNEYQSLIDELEQEKIRGERQMSQAGHDIVTGLPNMLKLEQVGNALIRNGSVNKMSLLVVKLNNFEQINQVMGHSNGDLLLAQAGQRIQKKVKDLNAVVSIELSDGERIKVANLGGVNFGILINTGDKMHLAQKVAKDFVENLMEPLVLQSCALEFDISAGIACYPDHGANMLELVNHAHDAICAVAGGHTKELIYTRDSEFFTNENIALMADLRQAIIDQQLMLHVQPLIDLSDNQVYGGEVFIRWRHPEKGLIPPGDFIVLAEQTGVIFSLTQWILGQVIEQLKCLSDAGLTQRLSVNIGNTDLMQIELVETIEMLAQQHGVDCSKLTLDIKESALLDAPEKALTMMKRIAHCGIGISLDDFGTGYTSLAYLRQLPLSEVKIDGSFVTTMGRSQSNAVITAAIIDIARKMELDVVAEGVEDAETADKLKNMGCSKAQGYYYSKPFELAGFTNWVQQWQKANQANQT